MSMAHSQNYKDREKYGNKYYSVSILQFTQWIYIKKQPSKDIIVIVYSFGTRSSGSWSFYFVSFIAAILLSCSGF